MTDKPLKIYVTGISGLIGSTVAEYAHSLGHEVWGTDCDNRGKWFGSSVEWRTTELYKKGIRVDDLDFRTALSFGDTADLIVHCASQPSHDYSRDHVLEDSQINYMGTVELLERVRWSNPKVIFAFMSTNKVYGDIVNTWEYEIEGKRYTPSPDILYNVSISEQLSIDKSLHTPFGVSKAAADLMVQEYRRCFGMRTVCFRCGCLTGKSGTPNEMQGFLGYLVKCAVEGRPYTIYGHEGYQVRDNIDAEDLARAVLAYAANPKAGVYNMGGGPDNSLSILETVDFLRTRFGCKFELKYGPERIGDHKWYISDTSKFEGDYPSWTRKNVWTVLEEMVDAERKRQNG